MQIVVLQESIQQVVNYIQKAVPTKAQLPILTAILITATETECTVGATDLYFGVRATVSAKITEPGSIAVPGKEFREIVSSLPAGEITLSYSGTTLTITAGKTICTLQCQDSSEYPPFPQIVGTTATLPAEVFTRIAQVSLFSASSDQARPLLTGVMFALSTETTRIVTTDGFRLSIVDAQNTGEQLPLHCILPARAISEVCRIAAQLQTKTITCTLSDELKQAYIQVEGIELYIRLLDGEYPPYERIIPASFTTEVVAPADELLEQVRRATIYSRESSSIVQFHVTAEKVEITAHSSTLGTYTGELETARCTGEGGTIAFKAKYILDFLQAVKGQEVWFGMNDGLKPAMFQSKDIPGFRYIVMPFRVSG